MSLAIFESLQKGDDLSHVALSVLPPETRSSTLRLVNAQSRQCLTAISTSDKANTSALPTISAWSAELPQADGVKHQIWNVKRTPIPKKAQRTAPTTVPSSTPTVPSSTPTTVPPSAPLTVSAKTRHRSKHHRLHTFIIESDDLATTSGAKHAFRVDLFEPPPVITDQTTKSALDLNINGLPPPFQKFSTAPPPPPTPPPPPPTPKAPTVVTRYLVASPVGSETSSFLLVPTHEPSRYWIYSPSSGLFLGQPPPANGTAPSAGAPVQAGDLQKYVEDTETYVHSLRRQPGWTDAKGKGIWDALKKGMTWWMWEFVPVDAGPQNGAYRIVHNTTLLSLDTNLQSKPSSPEDVPRHRPFPTHFRFTNASHTAITAIQPHAQTQIFALEAQPDARGTGKITYSIPGFPKVPLAPRPADPSSTTATPQTRWRLVRIPPPTAKSPPPMPLYVIYEPDLDEFLAVSPFLGRLVFVSVEVKGGATTVLTRMYNDPEDFILEFDWLAWQFVQEGWGPEDGLYEIINSPTSTELDLSVTDFSDPASILVNPPSPSTFGSSWWNLVAAVAGDGAIYYNVRNYRSGATLDLGNADAVVARRVGAPIGDRWQIVRKAKTDSLYSFFKLERPGTALATSTSPQIVLAGASDVTRSWSLRKVVFQITPGTYYFVNMGTNLLLSANTFSPNEPVLARAYKPGDPEQVWTVSAQPGVSDGFFVEASQGGVSLSAPPAGSTWAPHPTSVITSKNDSRTGWTFVKEQTSNAFRLLGADGRAPSVVGNEDDGHSVVLIHYDGSPAQLWRAVPVGLTLSSAWKYLPPAGQSLPVTNVPDGVYRIINRHNKLNLVLGSNVQQGRPHLTSIAEIALVAQSHEYSPYELWYISRNRDPALAAQDQTYTLRSLACPLYLDQSDPNARQRVSGLTCWATEKQDFYPTQQWTISQQNAFSFVIQSTATGCVLDVDSSKPVCTPLLGAPPSLLGAPPSLLGAPPSLLGASPSKLDAYPTALQTWQLNLVKTPLTSGNYKIVNEYTQTTLSVTSPPPNVVCADYAALGLTSSQWRLTGLSDGLYRIESITGLTCLAPDPVFPNRLILLARDGGLECRWRLRQAVGATFFIENAATCLLLTLKDGSAEAGAPVVLGEAGRERSIPWQKFRFERLDIPAHSFDDVGSDKITFGCYVVSNVRTNQVLTFSSYTPAVGDRPVCTAPTTTTPQNWTITPAATGHYSFQQSGLALGQGLLDANNPQKDFPVALPDGFDATRWKLLKGDGRETYRIINKYTGLLLVQSEDGTVTCAVDDGVSPGQEWMLVTTGVPSKAQTVPAKPSTANTSTKPSIAHTSTKHPDTSAKPSTPAIPAKPSTPVISAKASTPVTSAKPSAPDPSTSSAGTSVKPSAPDTPAKPSTPATPAKPGAPDTSAKPSAPVTSAKPDAPDTSAKPSAPDLPTKPDAPGLPKMPDAPGPSPKPVTSAKPGTAGTPTKPSANTSTKPNTVDSSTKPSTAAVVTPALPKEVPVQNSMFQFVNSQTNNCITMDDRNSVPKANAPRDLGAFSVNIRLQVWIVEGDAEGWYIIKSFPFDIALGTGSTPALVVGSNDGTPSYQWKFIQDAKATTVKCVNRRFPSYVLAVLDGPGTLQLVLDGATPIQRWSMVRVSGVPPDKQFAQGVYTISLYARPTVSSATAAAQQSKDKFQRDATKLNSIHASVDTVTTSLSTNFPAPALPAGIDTGAIEAALAPLDFRNAHDATVVAVNVIGFLHQASLSPPASETKTSAGEAKTSSSGTTTSAGGTTTSTGGTVAPAGGAKTSVSGSNVQPTPISFQIASSKIAKLISDYIGSNTDVGQTAQAINATAKAITPLTDTSAAHLAELIKSLANTIVSQIATFIASLPQQSSTGDGSSVADTLTFDSTISAAASITASATQYWLVESAPNDAGLYTLSHFTTKQYLVLGPTASSTSQIFDVALQTQMPGPEGLWQISLQRMGGYAIINSSRPDQVFCVLSGTTKIACLHFIEDTLTDDQHQQRWQFQRSGYYLQNQASQNSVNAALADVTANAVRLGPYSPFLQTKLIDGVRADAYFIWHLHKVDNGYRLYNEHTRSPLFNTGSNGDALSANPGNNVGDNSAWKLAKKRDSNQIFLQCQDHGRWMALTNANSAVLCLQDMGDQEDWKGWQLVSVAGTEKGTLMSLPRCALVAPSPGEQSLVFAVNSSNNSLEQQHYQFDNSYQRFRIATFSDKKMYINEATLRVIQSGSPAFSTTDFTGINRNCWFSGADGSISSINSSTPVPFQKVVTNTGDLPTALSYYRIQVGNTPSPPTMVLGTTASGDPSIVPYNTFDRTQLWSILEWGLGRFIMHVSGSKLLSVAGDGTSISLAPGNVYTQAAMWTVDTSNATAPNVSGFFKLRPAISSDPNRSVQPQNQNVSPSGALPVLSSTGSFGLRFVSVSDSFNFTWRAKMLATFVKSYMPIFVHAKNAPLPVDVPTYLKNSTLVNKNDPTVSLSTQPVLRVSGPGDWVLRASVPTSDGKTASAYIVVRQVAEPIYLDYTDFTVWLLYPPTSPTDASKGWRSITMRVSNDSNRVEAVNFPDGGQGWVYNLDMNFSALLNTKNPLRFIKNASSMMRLRVYVSPELTISPFFPGSTQDSDIVDDTKWQFVFDSGDNSQVIEADMIRDDTSGSKPVKPQWMSYLGRWFDGTGAGAHGPASQT